MYVSPVLVVVDMQNGFVNGASRHIVPTVLRLVEEWPGETVFTRFVNRPGSPQERLLGSHGMRGAPETELIPELSPHADRVPDRVMDKYQYTYFNTAGGALAKARNWQEFVICGIATDRCVLKTAVDAFELGYTPFVVADACASQSGSEAHEAGLFVIRRLIGPRQVIDVAQALGAALRSTAREAR